MCVNPPCHPAARDPSPNASRDIAEHGQQGVFQLWAATGLPPDDRDVIRYATAMRRFASVATPAAVPTRAPPAEPADLLGSLRGAERLPWPDAAATTAEERRALGLAHLAGAQGERLAAAILQETERLLAATEQAALHAPAAPCRA